MIRWAENDEQRMYWVPAEVPAFPLYALQLIIMGYRFRRGMVRALENRRSWISCEHGSASWMSRSRSTPCMNSTLSFTGDAAHGGGLNYWASEYDKEIAQHMDRVHEYNELKDIAQALMGRLATIEGVLTRDLYKRYTSPSPAFCKSLASPHPFSQLWSQPGGLAS